MNDALHEYLRICSGLTAAHMYRDLERSRRLGILWQGVPDTRESFDAGLPELAGAGLAKQGDGIWYWSPQRRVAVREPQKELFV